MNISAFWKRWAGFLVIILLSVSLAGCQTTPPTDQSSTGTGSNTSSGQSTVTSTSTNSGASTSTTSTSTMTSSTVTGLDGEEIVSTNTQTSTAAAATTGTTPSPSTNTTTAATPSVGTVKVNSTLNIRSAPWGSIVGSLRNNDTVNIVAKEGDWYKISHSGGTAYVHANYISTPGQDATGVAPTQPGSGDTPSNPATPAPTTAPAPGNGRFGAPVVANMPSRTSSEYGPRNMYGRSYHYGVDLPIANGTPLQAMGDGVVVSVGYQNSGGRYVVIRYDNGYQSSYCHLQSASVSAGQRVSMGQVVARSDNTGQSTGPHLHLGMKRNGSWVNPRDVPGLVLPPRR